MAVNLYGVYHNVITDVINNVRGDFVKEGVDEDILQQLKSLWELKLMHFRGGYDDSHYVGSMVAPSISDLNIPHNNGQTPTADLLFPPTPVHTPLPTFLPAGPSLSMADIHDNANGPNIALGRPAPYMVSPWMNQRTDLNPGPKLDMNIAYDGGEEDEAADGRIPLTKEFLPPSITKRKRDDAYVSGSYLPQHDGSGDTMTMPRSFDQALCADEAQNTVQVSRTSLVGQEHLSKEEERERCTASCTSVQSLLPQFDGGFEEDYNEVVAEDYNEPGDDDNGPGKEQQEEKWEANINVHAQPLDPTLDTKAEALGELEPPLGEEDDLEEIDDILTADARFETENVVYAQFEKVSRLKSKWKCVLKDGIMHLNNRDHLFSKATGEFEF